MNKTSVNSFFFQLRPSYFQLDHSYAKNLKSGTTYRLQVFKGIQQIDQMTEPIKGRLIGGKIFLNSISLNFYLALFNPTKNISFTIVVLQTKPKQGQLQLAKHIIKSNDYITQFLNQRKSIHKEEVQLINGFKFVYELFLNNSKIQLDQIVQQHQNKEQGMGKMTRSLFTPVKGGYATDTFSQSDADQSGKEGTPPNFKKKLSRRRGHQGKLKIKNANSDAYSQRDVSIISSKNNYEGANNQCDYGFIKRSQLPEESLEQSRKTQNLVCLTRRDSNASEILIPLQPTLQQKGLSCTEKIQSSHSQIIEPKKQVEQSNNKMKTSNIDIFCGIEDINQSTVSCSNNKSSHRISIRTKDSLYEPLPLLKLKPSMMMRRNYSSSSDSPQQSAKRQFQSARQFLFYSLFTLISLFLLYNAISPSRRV